MATTSGLPAPVPQRRISFRRRLLVSQGLVLATAFGIIGILGWVVSFGWMHYHSWALLEEEAEEIAFHIVGVDGYMNPGHYAWHEPHHLYREARVDPYFVQLFDTEGRLIFESANVASFGAAYPDTLVPYTSSTWGTFSSLNLLEIEDQTLYLGYYPIPGLRGQVLGSIQIARYEPNIAGRLQELALGLSFGLLGLLGLLLFLTDRVARRTLRPLRSITRVADSLTPAQMAERIPIPSDADWESTRLAETLNALLDRLEHALENMRRFTANAAHELQTPLTVLRGHVEVTLRRSREPGEYQHTLQTLAGEIDGMSNTIRSLLLMARLERNPRSGLDTEFDLTEVVRHETALFVDLAREKGLRWTERLESPVLIAGHPDLMRDVVRNILDNAVKFTRAGEIEVSSFVRAGRGYFSVHDSGVGIAPESLPHVTERFYRAEDAGTSGPGSGLGLSLVDQIVGLHGGSLEIASTPAHGTRVTVHLPPLAREVKINGAAFPATPALATAVNSAA